MPTDLLPASPDDVRRGRQTLLALAALFFVPLFIAFALYYGGGWRPAQGTNHGELIQPARTVPADWAQDSWSLVYVGNGACDASCRDTLGVMRQTRLALANEMTRVQRVFVATQYCCDRQLLEREHRGLRVIDATGSDAGGLVDVFPAADRARTLFIVDPLGNLIMKFDARQNPKGLLTDLKKLLKLSHIG